MLAYERHVNGVDSDYVVQKLVFRLASPQDATFQTVHVAARGSLIPLVIASQASYGGIRQTLPTFLKTSITTHYKKKHCLWTSTIENPKN